MPEQQVHIAGSFIKVDSFELLVLDQVLKSPIAVVAIASQLAPEEQTSNNNEN